MRGPFVVVGDVLLDVDVEGDVERLSPEAPVPVLDERARASRPGGAGLAATLAAADGRDVVLVTALARDDEAGELRRLLPEAGVRVVDLGGPASTPVKERVRCDGRVLLRIDRGGGESSVGPLPPAAREALAGAGAVLVADYGRGVAARSEVRRALADEARRRVLVWDPHPRGSEPVPGARLVTPNAREAARLVPDAAGDELITAASERARALAARWRAHGVAITLGPGGALLAAAGARSPIVVPAAEVRGGDPCGAGDRFAATVAGSLADGALLPEAVAAAVEAASAFVAAGGAGSVRLGAPPPLLAGARPASAEDVVARTRAAGGTVVMTGGCFDLLHAGHVATLQAARALGDCLVVCLNSDESVRRLKGTDRPLVPEEDRAAVLTALACVDAVAIFDERTPEAVLERFRPDVFAKGGDYALEDLPETRTLARWGGEVVILPYVEGRSTTRLLEEVLVRGAG